MRVGAIRWSTEPAAKSPQRGLELMLAAGKPGESCVRVSAGRKQLAEHCTYGVVWPGSLRASPRGDAVTFAVSSLPGWCELVLLRRAGATWSAETLAPAAVDPELGYVELAGWSPDGARLLVAREARMTGPLGAPGTQAPWVARSFQILARRCAHRREAVDEARELPQLPSLAVARLDPRYPRPALIHAPLSTVSRRPTRHRTAQSCRARRPRFTNSRRFPVDGALDHTLQSGCAGGPAA